jgi:hypothetical protein
MFNSKQHGMYHLLECDALQSGACSHTFRSNVLTPFSGPKVSEARIQQGVMLIACLAYS